MTRVVFCIALTLPAQALACGMKISKELLLADVLEQVDEQPVELAAEEALAEFEPGEVEATTPTVDDQTPADKKDPEETEPAQHEQDPPSDPTPSQS